MRFLCKVLVFCIILLLHACSAPKKTERVRSIFFSGDKLYILGEQSDFVSVSGTKNLQILLTQTELPYFRISAQVHDSRWRYERDFAEDRMDFDINFDVKMEDFNKKIWDKYRIKSATSTDMKGNSYSYGGRHLAITLKRINLVDREQLIQKYPVENSKFPPMEINFTGRVTKLNSTTANAVTYPLGIIALPIVVPLIFLTGNVGGGP